MTGTMAASPGHPAASASDPFADDFQPGAQVPGESIVYLNGTYVPESEAKISVFDHAVMTGDGVFDTCCAWNGFVFHLEAHADRLLRSLRGIHLDARLSVREWCDIVVETTRRNALQNAYIKIVVTRGLGLKPLLDPRDCVPTVIVFAKPYSLVVNTARAERGCRVRVVSTRRIPPQCLDPKIKSLNYLNLVMARLEATSAGVDEAIMLDVDGYVSESPGNNVFVVRDGVVMTPPENILEGITRETVFELCAQADLPFEARQLTMYDLHNADEAFLTSTAGGITPIIEVDGRSISAGTPGPITALIRSAYWSALSRGEHGTPVYQMTGSPAPGR